MFDGMPDHFYHFLAATSTPPPPPQQQQLHQPIFDASYLLHCHHHQQQPNGLPEPVSPWSNEEVLALLKIRSTLDSNPWFPSEFTWLNVSRKLEEIGFKRSAENCKQKFEEQITRTFNNTNNNFVINSNKNHNNNNNIISQNYRLFGELEELYNCNDDDDVGNDAEIDDHNKDECPPNQLDYHPDDDSRTMSFYAKNGQSQVRSDDDNEVGDQGQENEKYLGNDVTGERGRGRGEDIVDDEIEMFEESTRKVMGRKRKRQKKFEMFKGFCEKIVNKMMEQQEEFHYKILQDMVKRDEEKIAREEAWKKQEIDMITKEFEVRAHEHAIVGDRQATILGFLSKFSSSSTNFVWNSMITKVQNTTSSLLLSTSSSSLLSHQDCVSATQLTSSCATTTTTTTTHDQSSMPNLVTQQKCNLPTSLSKETQPFENPNHPITTSSQDGCPRSTSISATRKIFASDHTNTDAPGGPTTIIESVKDDIGRRWPRDEVLALINIRCSLFNNNNNGGDHQYDKERSSKGPLWERVSQKMLELGYKRSSKRCKEKWENINKYFRKTKDLNKKRSTDSRTCPYFHQLSHLYNNQSNRHENVVGSPPENQSRALSGGQGGSSTSNGATTTSTTTTNVHGGNEGSVVQMSAEFGFEF